MVQNQLPLMEQEDLEDQEVEVPMVRVVEQEMIHPLVPLKELMAEFLFLLLMLVEAEVEQIHQVNQHPTDQNMDTKELQLQSLDLLYL